MKRVVVILVSCLLLAACSNTSSPTTTQEKVLFSAPKRCEIPGVIAAFNKQVPGSKYVPTQWQPSEGTDLYDIYQAGGIACTYGIQTAEIGGTIMWANVDDALWSNKKSQWQKQGQLAIDIPGIDETEAFVLREGSTSADEMHVWAINLFINGVWVQVGATFLQNIDEAAPIISAAIDALEN